MSIVKYKKISIEKICIYIFAFLIIYESGTVYSLVSIKKEPYSKVLLLFLATYFAFKSLKTVNRYLELFLWLIILGAYCIINLVNYSGTTGVLIYRSYIFLVALFSLSYFKSRSIDFCKYICMVIIFLAYTSLIIYFLVRIMNFSLPYSIFQLRGESNIDYYNFGGLYFDTGYANNMFGLTVYRMTGPFWEPGVFQIFLNYALFMLFKNEKINKGNVIIIIIDLFLTFSSAGWITACILFVYRFYKNKKNDIKSKVILGIPILIVGVATILNVLFLKFDESFINGKNGSSTYIRVNDILLSLRLFKENIVFGTGYFNTEPFVKNNIFNSTVTKGCSNGFLTICFTMGIVGIIFVCLPFILNIYRAEKKHKKDEIVNATLILIFNFCEPIYYLPFMLMILALEYHKLFIRQKI